MRAKNYGYNLVAILLIYVWQSIAPAQELKKVSAAEAASHLLKSVKAQYPPMASMAHIQGDVVLSAVITETGAVRDVKAVMGHPLLQPPAIQAARQYKYKPFLENNRPVLVQTTIRVGFVMDESPLEPEFQQADTACQLAIERQQFVEGEQPCNRAAAVAERLPEGFDRYRFAAFGNAGMVATRLSKPAEAAHYFEQQVHLAESSRQFSSGPGASVLDARLNLARAYSFSGKLENADTTYATLEKAIQTLQKNLKGGSLQVRPAEAADKMSRGLTQQLKQALEEHAALLRKMGKNSEADQLDQQAKSLTD